MSITNGQQEMWTTLFLLSFQLTLGKATSMVCEVATVNGGSRSLTISSAAQFFPRPKGNLWLV